MRILITSVKLKKRHLKRVLVYWLSSEIHRQPRFLALSPFRAFDRQGILCRPKKGACMSQKDSRPERNFLSPRLCAASLFRAFLRGAAAFFDISSTFGARGRRVAGVADPLIPAPVGDSTLLTFDASTILKVASCSYSTFAIAKSRYVDKLLPCNAIYF